MEYKRTLLNFSYVLPGFLAGMARPGTLDSLRHDLLFLRAEGITAILSLSESPLDEQLIREDAFEYLHIPVPDFTAPTIEQVARGMEFVEKMIEAKRPVAVHCGAGCGRTGAFLACYFVKQGESPEQAILHIRSLRPCSIETGSQRELVYRYAEFLTSRL
jgi:protein-tyrosine phosphatase